MTSTTTTRTTPAGYADAAAEAVRALNGATLHPEGVDPTEVASTLGSLASLSHRLDQACTQLARTLTRAGGVYDLRDDRGDDPTTTLAVAEDHLRQAAAVSRQLRDHLDQAWAAASHLGYRTPTDTDDDTDTDPVLW